MKFGLLGYPLGHSFSQRLLSALGEKFALDMDYRNFEVKIEDLGGFLKKARGELNGFNVTIPYKEKVIPYLDELSEEAREIGSVNVVKVKEGKLLGHNTDWIGFKNPLEGKKLGKRGFLYGAGGAARASLYGMWGLGFTKVFLSNRTPFHAQSLATDFSDKLEIIPLPFQESGKLSETCLVVNSTPLGMWPKTDELPPLPQVDLSGKVCYDIVYNPPITSFLKKAQSLGAEVIGGRRMFLVQAAKSIQIWLGMDLSQEVEICFDSLLPENPTEKHSSE